MPTPLNLPRQDDTCLPRQTPFDRMKYIAEINDLNAEKVLEGREPIDAGFAIDSPTTILIDDFVNIECIPEGYRLTVSVADVGAIVPKSGIIDAEAMRRLYTRYDERGMQTLSMIPRIVRHKCAQVGVFGDKLEQYPLLSMVITLNHNFEPTDVDKGIQVKKTRIEKAVRLSPDEVDKIRDNPNHPENWRLSLLYELVMKREDKVRERIIEASNGKRKGHFSSPLFSAIIRGVKAFASELMALKAMQEDQPMLYVNRGRNLIHDHAQFMVKDGLTVSFDEFMTLMNLGHRAREILEHSRFFSNMSVGNEVAYDPNGVVHFMSAARHHDELSATRRIANMAKVKNGKHIPGGKEHELDSRQIAEMAAYYNTRYFSLLSESLAYQQGTGQGARPLNSKMFGVGYRVDDALKNLTRSRKSLYTPR